VAQAVQGRQRSACIVEAATLVAANTGAAERLLAAHHPKPDGRCHGCGSHLIHWPCVLVAIAHQAQALRAHGPTGPSGDFTPR
jgi:hypothetical protein